MCVCVCVYVCVCLSTLRHPGMKHNINCVLSSV